MNGKIIQSFYSLNVGALLIEKIISNFIGNTYFQGVCFFLGGFRFNFPESAQCRIFQRGADTAAAAEGTSGITDFLNRGMLLLA